MPDAKTLKALIFDFNGVIIDDEEYHYEALKKVLAEHGINITRESYFNDCLGFNDAECFFWALKTPDSIQKAGGMDRLIGRKSRYYFELLERDTRFFPGTIDFIREVSSRYLLAVASMAMRDEITCVLRKAGVYDCFKVIVAAEDVKNTKPDPEVYLKALERLNEVERTAPLRGPIRAEHCLVIEDSLPGIRAAKAAGMWCLAVANSVREEDLHGADWTCQSLKGLTLADLESLYTRMR